VKKVSEPDRPHVTIWRMHVASWTPNATKTLSEYVIFWPFHGRYMYVTSLV